MAITAGDSLNLTPSPKKASLSTNYIDFIDGSTGWEQQYLPDLMEAEAEVFGKRTVSGFLKQVGAEEAMTADQVVWSEQGRLHLAYTGTIDASASKVTIAGLVGSNATYANDHGLRVGDTVLVTDAATGLKTLKCYVSTTAASSTQTAGQGAGNTDATLLPYSKAAMTGTFADNDQLNIFVYGKEFAKGSASQSGELKPQFTQFSNKPIIIKDHFKINGSDTASIGWIETTDEAGQTGFSWYLKSAGETRLRFEDYLETSLIEAEKADSASVIHDATGGLGMTNATEVGTEGLFSAISTRGNVFEDLASLGDFDLLLKNLDKQGAIEENMLYVNRSLALTLDDMVAGLNANYQGGASFGVFNNDADMALNLGFSAFRRGSYDFYKSDWKYLNDASARGGFGDISGCLIPAGTSTVYDQSLGKNMTRPFLHVRYRSSATDDRKLKTWVTGSVGSASYIGDDFMEVHYLSERCLVVQGANNFVLLKES